MKVLNVINNNVVSSLDEKKREIIVMGKGLGFKKKSGDVISEDLIEKVFRLPDATHDRFTKIIQDISYTHLKLASDIIDYAYECVGHTLRKSIYVTLTDHLNFAIQREKEGMIFPNALLSEIKQYYVKEYEVGKYAQKLVEEQEGVHLSDDEAGFISLHIINAEEDEGLVQSLSFLNMVKDILEIIQDSMKIEFQEESTNYKRFLTHLKFFIQRAIKKEYNKVNEVNEVFQDFLKKCPEECDCAHKIIEYAQEKLDYDTSDEELVYLVMHLNRLKRT